MLKNNVEILKNLKFLVYFWRYKRVKVQIIFQYFVTEILKRKKRYLKANFYLILSCRIVMMIEMCHRHLRNVSIQWNNGSFRNATMGPAPTPAAVPLCQLRRFVSCCLSANIIVQQKKFE